MNGAKNEIQKAPKNISQKVLARVHAMQDGKELQLPDNYSAENALSAAYLTLKGVKNKAGLPAEAVCKPETVATALLDMVVQGLSPAKNQCYFVIYGDELTLMRSYMGTIAAAKRLGGVRDVFAQVVYQGDEFAYEINPATGVKRITKHQQTLESTTGEIKAAYATVLREGVEPYQEIMTIDEIRKAWNQGATKGASPAHKNFPQEMAKKTVINRACKIFINTTDDSGILADAYNRTTANEYRADADEVVQVETYNETSLEAIFGAIDEENRENEQIDQNDTNEAVIDAESLTEVL